MDSIDRKKRDDHRVSTFAEASVDKSSFAEASVDKSSFAEASVDKLGDMMGYMGE